jgi:hypothetical protein
MIASSGVASDAGALVETLSPLIRMEIAGIGAIGSISPREKHPAYTVLFHDARQGKQANVEQMNTLLRLIGKAEVGTGGMLEPILHLQTLILQRASFTVLLSAMRLVEETLVARYRDALPSLDGIAQKTMEHILGRAARHWVTLLAHGEQRKERDSRRSDNLPLPLSAYFATDEDRVCMRCLFDRAGEHPALEKEDPYTYLCAACHDETIREFPSDLREQMSKWSADAHRNRVLHKALGRPMKMKAIEEVQAVLAGLSPEIPASAAEKAARSLDAPTVRHRRAAQPAADLSLGVDGTAEEQAYTDLLFDFRSVRRSW